jgi:hypothetical protein
MLKRFASGLGICTLAAATGLAAQELAPSVPAVRPASQPAAASAVRAPDRMKPEPIREVQALDRHARTGMVLYAGAFGGPAKKEALPALAVNFKLAPPRR